GPVMYSAGRRRGEDGIAVVIDFLLANARLVMGVGGAAVLGVATLLVKRVIDLSQQHSGCPPAASPVSDVKLRHAPPTLQDRLQQYYHTRVCVSRAEAQRAHRVALEVGAEIQAFLRTKHPEMPLGDVSVAGSLLDELQVLRADRACLLVALQVEETLWTPLRGEDTFLSHPHLCMLRRENLEYFPRGRSYWDRFLVGGYMSSRLIGDLLRKSVTEAMNWPSLSGTLDCEVRPLLGPQPDRPVRPRLVPQPLQRRGGPPGRSRPIRRRREEEVLEDADGGVPHVPRPQSPRWPAPQEPDFAPQRPGVRLVGGAFSGRFRQAIVELIGCLEVGQLPSYFKPAVNLLSQFGEDDIDEMGFLLYCALSEPEQLLITVQRNH
uniref:Mitochondrial dynamics protein MID51-like C-terminal domain-containing protein n=1 Tax=Denticeps clupeoides TaxID=299321 RepID=A0AAY4CML4_9TELE